jgi:transposase
MKSEGARAGGREAARRLEMLRTADRAGNVTSACRRFGVSRTTFYYWRSRFREGGKAGLRSRSRRPVRHARITEPETVAKILFLRLTFRWGPPKIERYLETEHQIRLSSPGIWKILKRLGLNRRTGLLPGQGKDSVHRDERGVPIHELELKIEPTRRSGRAASRAFRYIARDAAAGLRFIRVFGRRDARTVLVFLEDILRRFPLRIGSISTPAWDEFRGQFHWDILGLGIQHVIRGPDQPGEAERANKERMRARGGGARFWRGVLLSDDDDFDRKLEEWMAFAAGG